MPMTSIDGFRVIAERTGKFAGINEITYNGKLLAYEIEDDVPTTATCTVLKNINGTIIETTATVIFKEFNKNNAVWKQMPFYMIGKVAEAHALRKAFPQDLSGLYTEDEMIRTEDTYEEAINLTDEQINIFTATVERYKKTEDCLEFTSKKKDSWLKGINEKKINSTNYLKHLTTLEQGLENMEIANNANKDKK